MIYKIYTFQYEANKFLYALGKGHQQYTKEVQSLDLAVFLTIFGMFQAVHSETSLCSLAMILL